MIIGIDIDGTVLELTHLWIDAMNKKFNLKIKEWGKKWHPWDTHKHTTKEQWYATIENHELHRDSRPFPLAVEIIKKWYREGHKIIFVTNTPQSSFHVKVEKIESIFNDIKYDIVKTNQKYLIKWDVLIEDNPTLFEDTTFCLKCMYRKIIMIKRPYNEYLRIFNSGYNQKGQFFAAQDWKHINLIVGKYNIKLLKKVVRQ